MEKIDFENEILLKNKNSGKLILLAERPSRCAVKTCLNAMKILKNSYFFDLDGETENLNLKLSNIDYTFYSSVELINKIYNMHKNNKTNLFIINNWKLVENKEEWFIQKLISLVSNYNIKIVVIDIFPRFVDNRRNHLPINKDFLKLNNLSSFIKTEKVYCINFSDYCNNIEKENVISYYKY